MELREEAGLRARALTLLGRLYPAYGCAANACDLYLATSLSAVPAEPKPEEDGIESRALPGAEFIRMIRSGEIEDAPTVAACCLLHLEGYLSA